MSAFWQRVGAPLILHCRGSLEESNTAAANPTTAPCRSPTSRGKRRGGWRMACLRTPLNSPSQRSGRTSPDHSQMWTKPPKPRVGRMRTESLGLQIRGRIPTSQERACLELRLVTPRQNSPQRPHTPRSGTRPIAARHPTHC